MTAGATGWLRRLVAPATPPEPVASPRSARDPRPTDAASPDPDPARSPRDAQRIRVYRAETPLVGRRFTELDQCRAYCEQVVGSFWWLERFPDHHLAAIPILRDGRGARQAFYREDPGHPTKIGRAHV